MLDDDTAVISNYLFYKRYNFVTEAILCNINVEVIKNILFN